MFCCFVRLYLAHYLFKRLNITNLSFIESIMPNELMQKVFLHRVGWTLCIIGTALCTERVYVLVFLTIPIVLSFWSQCLHSSWMFYHFEKERKSKWLSKASTSASQNNHESLSVNNRRVYGHRDCWLPWVTPDYTKVCCYHGLLDILERYFRCGCYYISPLKFWISLCLLMERIRSTKTHAFSITFAALIGGVALGLANPTLGCLADRYYLSKISTFGIFIISGRVLAFLFVNFGA